MINATELMVTDLRDTGGHVIKVLRIESFDANYTKGGILVDPDDFGMTDIEFIHLQGITAYQNSPEEPAIIASEQTAMRFVDPDGQEYWKIFIFVPDEAGLMVELPDDSPLSFPDNMRIVFMVTGS